MTYTSPVLKELFERGFIYQASDVEGLDAKLKEGPCTFYIGYDATAQSLHVGNLVTIMAARIMQRHGHRPLILMGGGTTKVGDPSGKDSARKMLSLEAISKNLAEIKKVFEKYLTFGPDAGKMLNNDAWLSSLKYLEFLREIGAHFTINRMISFDIVKRRLDSETPISFLEFNYMLLQAYDFLHLYRSENCILELGGSDQWANILNGVELVRRCENGQSYGLTLPLITTATGQKMGKSENGAIWLNANLLSPFEYWQFWRNTADADVIKFMRLFTDVSVEEIRKMEAVEGAALNPLKKRLADEATRILHGEDVLSEIHETAAGLFENKGAALTKNGEDNHGNAILTSGAPIQEMKYEVLESGLSIIEAFKLAGLCHSNGEVRRLIKGGGARLNDVKIEAEDLLIHKTNLQEYNTVKLGAGKKKTAYLHFKH